jgi:hypothetical protein
LFLGCAWVGATSAQGQFVFLDGFESGGTCAWSVRVGGGVCAPSGLYAHSGQNLYRIDAATFEAVLIGPFNTGGPSITDIALDKDGVMVGISLAKLWSIDVATGVATPIGDFDGGSEGLTSLSFVPLDASNPASAERLVAAGSTGNVFEVNRSTGATTLLGNYGTSNGSQIRSGGDIVSVRGFGTLATVTIGDTPSDNDFLATINATTWAASPIGSFSIGYDRVLGLGYWGGALFGFVDDGAIAQTGQMITIDPANGIGALVRSSAVRWSGAGVATDAPVPP